MREVIVRYDAKNGYRIREAEEKEKRNERPRRLAKQAREFETTRLASVRTRPNKFFAAKRKAVRLYEIARRRNYFISLRAAAVIT